jgi:Domain of unknown function (DUF3784)
MKRARTFVGSDADIGRIVILIMGCFNVLLGFVIRKYQLAEIISGYNPDKYDKKKICDIVGGNFLLMGLLMIFVTVIYYFVPALDMYLYITSVLTIYFGLIIKIILDSRHAKIR